MDVILEMLANVNLGKDLTALGLRLASRRLALRPPRGVEALSLSRRARLLASAVRFHERQMACRHCPEHLEATGIELFRQSALPQVRMSAPVRRGTAECRVRAPQDGHTAHN